MLSFLRNSSIFGARVGELIVSKHFQNVDNFILNSCGVHLSAVRCKRRKTAEERKAPKVINYTPKSKVKAIPVVQVWKNITVAELAQAMGKDIDHVYEVMTFVDNSAEYDSDESQIDNPSVIQDILKKSGFRFQFVSPHTEEEKESKLKDVFKRPPPEDPSALKKRPPVVTIMGHVDHGKTTLLDTLRHTSVVESEFGGITQHIGAFSVELARTGETVTFLDTPGHAAFTAMRSRGAHITDIVVLVVAADDGVMEQTVESMNMAKDAKVPILVAINKIDKPEADIERTKRMLLQQGIELEESGGEVQSVPISALKATGIDELIEAIALQAELLDLRGDPTGPVEAVVVESRVDIRRGKLATVLVQRGTLTKGAVLVAGEAWAKVRSLFDDKGKVLDRATPSTPVEVVGWRDLPSAGEEILQVDSEKIAHEVMRFRKAQKQKQKQELDYEAVKAKEAEHLKKYKAELEERRKRGRYKVRPTGPQRKQIIMENTGPRFSIVVKGDVDGSVEAILDVLETYEPERNCDYQLDIVHYGVGEIVESDVELAEAFGAYIYGFNITMPEKVAKVARKSQVKVRMHNVIYRLVDDIKSEIKERLPPKEVEDVLGEANVLQEFVITEGKKKVPVAGCRCVKGVLKKNAKYRVKRGEEVIHEGELHSMRHLKNEVDSIKTDVECGLQLNDHTIRFKPGDTLICYVMREETRETDWDPGF
ncbi:translation initiation factor IF-2, mitochondrial [Ischnura elegans]|uniref:translation initiation factor IF-2, mitochondrial n=1 Tax=Ischnura elegans TaxID=197161 RepID=UPI001ED88F69|nr:translation initiation factor IF-2, mitochondrial [Ischnura elegans]